MLSHTGLDGVTMRGVADHLGLRLNNVQYYFPSRDALIQGFAEMVVEQYQQTYDPLMSNGDLSWDEKVRQFVRFNIADTLKVDSRRRFLSILSYAQRDAFTMERVHDLYAYQQHTIQRLLRELNSKRQTKLIEMRAAMITAQIEGLMVLAGQRSEFREMPQDFEHECFRAIVNSFRLA
ncbi:hypothetical protein D3C72_1414840 [compost metagenome]